MASRIREVQTTFQGGQIDKLAKGRSDIGLFKQSVQNGENWRLISTGGVRRRPGTKYLADLGADVRLIPFEFDDDNLYLFAVEAGTIKIYDNAGVEIAGSPLTVTAITANNLWEFSWVQSGDFMFICHKDFVTQEIQRTSATTFSRNDYAFDLDDNAIRQIPHSKFATVSTTIEVKVSAPFELQTSENHWTTSHVGKQVRVYTGSAWETFEIITYNGQKKVEANHLTSGTATTTPTKRWTEEAVNDIWGFPQAVCFHAGRLWFGGFKSLPAHIAGSAIGLYWNFNVEDGTADDALFAPIDSDRINSVRHIISGQHLQVFTDLSEMHLSEEEGQPITPTSFAIRNNTRYGSSFVRPIVFDDATLYVQHQGKVIREYLWNSLNRGYTSNPLSLMANDIVKTVRQSAIDYGGEGGPEQYCYFVNSDGSMAVYHALRSEQVNGFFPWTTQGDFKSCAVLGDTLYASVKRTINAVDYYWLEKFDIGIHMDGAVEKTSGTPTDTFTGLTQYANQSVHVTSENNGYYLGEYTIDGSGQLDLSINGFTATQIWVGLNYTATAQTMPINFGITTGSTEQLPKRIVSGFVRADSSYDFVLQGETFVPRLVQDDISQPPSRFTGIKRAHMLGAAFDRSLSVVSDIPLDCTILSMGVEVGL